MNVQAEFYQYLIIATPLLAIWILYNWYKTTQTRGNLAIKSEAVVAGLTEPASLHPIINSNICLGCGSCVNACPEAKHQVLGLIDNKAELLNPADCIGHGACKTACPADAIQLVFGTERRGLDIPNVKPDFQTNIPGIYIAGELGGMGLIKNATEQGRRAMDEIAKVPEMGSGGDLLDVLVVGAGPAGITATLGAMEKNLKVMTIEQESLGGTVAQFPRGKLVMTAPAKLPIVGEFQFKETTKEKLIEFWSEVERKTGLKVNYKERVDHIDHLPEGGFEVTTNKSVYRTRAVLLAIGRRGTPRKLGVPGEDQHKVVYRLVDPAQYQGKHVLIVGGGDSALEAATSIADEPGTTVTLSYRSGAFGRAKEKNRRKVDAAVESGRLNLMLSSTISEVLESEVVLNQNNEHYRIPNDGVIVCAGGILPTGFLKQIGIEVETKYGTA
ncbi:NAD(P)-binding domain-containing protein [Amphritea japonica]|uniref:4Fe-4S ferredoxin n=1 Tax=Amphritea japonica ATCC BAA-1530 TaxID=1278309 RepID=A0A7R6SSY2_9GAMM|nr:NAD(P)-binding domain-containing protein [Amphritea japonica]BBB26746.1 4Fe-4S ferredoxin [Amphritea japonica ATCC BAA-1530]